MWLPKWRRNQKRSHMLWRNAEEEEEEEENKLRRTGIISSFVSFQPQDREEEEPDVDMAADELSKLAS